METYLDPIMISKMIFSTLVPQKKSRLEYTELLENVSMPIGINDKAHICTADG